MKLKETCRRFTPEQVPSFPHEGREHPSSLKTIDLLADMISVLDGGCGTGVMSELIREPSNVSSGAHLGCEPCMIPF